MRSGPPPSPQGIPQTVLVGHDWGGAVVWNMALFYPERVRWVPATRVAPGGPVLPPQVPPDALDPLNPPPPRPQQSPGSRWAPPNPGAMLTLPSPWCRRAVASLNTPYRPADPAVDIVEKMKTYPTFDYQFYFQEPVSPGPQFLSSTPLLGA